MLLYLCNNYYNIVLSGYTITGTRKRKSKWDPDLTTTAVPGFPLVLPLITHKEQLDALLLRLRIEEITRKLATEQYDEGVVERSPSPEPQYDNNGKRTNTREQRQKEKLTKERQKYVTEAMLISPYFRPPADYVPPSAKKTKKIYIPVKEYPEYNFIGLIIGPRGNMQKRMERASGAKIAIRGKGAAKEGKANKVQYFDDDELHVLLTADTDEQIAKADQLVRQLLVPISEDRNEIKKDQLRELAKINGTLREGSWNVERSFDTANVKCTICGEVSHPTKDCPQAKEGGAGGVPKTIDDEYESFLVEIGEKKKEDAPTPGAAAAQSGGANNLDESYDEFMAAIGDVAQKPAHAPHFPPQPFMPFPHPHAPHMPHIPHMPHAPHLPHMAPPIFNPLFPHVPPPFFPHAPHTPHAPHAPFMPPHMPPHMPPNMPPNPAANAPWMRGGT
jgi:hypothetical protein